jgi:peptidyl-prolyl cis-trans isomerase A (cyclophilin A)
MKTLGGALRPRRRDDPDRHRRRLLALPALALVTLDARADTSGAVVRTRVVTALGEFVIEVDTRVAPVTVANYLGLVDWRLLDGGSVYRVVTLANQPADTLHKIEVVQWGRNRPDGEASPTPPIAHETTRMTGLRHRDGTVSMARAAPGSASSEFFVCVGDQPALDFGGGRQPDGQGFAAFGQVVEGMAVVRALHARSESQQMLTQPIAIVSVRRLDVANDGAKRRRR